MKGLLRLASVDRRGFFLALLTGTLATSSTIALMGVSAWMLSRASHHPPAVEIGLAAVAVRAFALTRAGGRYVERLASHNVALAFAGRLRANIYARLATGTPLSTPSAAALTREVDQLADVIVRGICPLAVNTVAVLAAVVFVSLVLPVAGAVLAVCAVTSGLVAPLLLQRHRTTLTHRLSHRRENYEQQIVSLVEGLPELTSLGATTRARTTLHDADHAVRATERSSALLDTLERFASTALTGIALTALLGIAIGASTGELIASIALIGLVTTDIASTTGTALQTLAESKVTIAHLTSRLEHVSEDRSRRRDAAQNFRNTFPREQSRPTASMYPSPTTSDIRLTDITVQWPDGSVGLDHLTLQISPGDKVAIVGPSGAGKTTLADVLAGFRRPSTGTYQLGDVDTSLLTGEQIRNQVLLVEHDAHLFAETIRNNLRLGKPDVTDDELDQLATRLGLTEWIDSLPERWNTRVGQGGQPVSGGQRRRLVVARALLADPAVLVLDEPTAHLDDANAVAITRDILATSGERTVAWVTHRLDELDTFDRVIRIETTDHEAFRLADPVYP
jgi:thiol reductant ABC exporter CydC subunit